MKLVYEANNGIEAQLIKDILEREGVFVRVDGEYLQGGIGELQAMGVVRVLVADDEAPRAKALITLHWDEA